MIIVSGRLIVDAADRDTYVRECVDVVTAARAAPGCRDFHITADPIDPDRVNVYEEWETTEAVEAFRGSGPSSEQAATIRDARVFQHEVASTLQL
jgi:quinol monooxygenase YgiN